MMIIKMQYPGVNSNNVVHLYNARYNLRNFVMFDISQSDYLSLLEFSCFYISVYIERIGMA